MTLFINNTPNSLGSRNMDRVRTSNARNTRLSPSLHLSRSGRSFPRQSRVKPIIKIIDVTDSNLLNSNSEPNKGESQTESGAGRKQIKPISRCKPPYPFINSSQSLSSIPPLSLDKAPALNLTSNQSCAQLQFVGSSIKRTSSDKKKILKIEQDIEVFLNLWQPTPAPKTLNRLTPMCSYDINTKLPFHLLETDQVRLEPLIPSKHLSGFLSLPKESWDVLGHIGPFPTEESALIEIEEWRKDPRSLLLAAIDKQREENGQDCFAGVYGLIEYNVNAGNILFGCINVHPNYHRTHINSHSMYLLLSFLFDECQLVRVQYDAVPWNSGSITAAKRFGFKEEGICRNLNGLVPDFKKREGEVGKRSQDLWLSSMTDQEWKNEGRGVLKGMTEREPVDTTVL